MNSEQLGKFQNASKVLGDTLILESNLLLTMANVDAIDGAKGQTSIRNGVRRGEYELIDFTFMRENLSLVFFSSLWFKTKTLDKSQQTISDGKQPSRTALSLLSVTQC